jgi:hypothetical protein
MEDDHGQATDGGILPEKWEKGGKGWKRRVFWSAPSEAM